MLNWLLLLFFTYALVGNTPATGQTLVTVKVDQSNVNVGLNTMISIWVEVQQGYHVQANTMNDESLVPTTLEVNSAKGITISKQEFPLGEQFNSQPREHIFFLDCR